MVSRSTSLHPQRLHDSLDDQTMHSDLFNRAPAVRNRIRGTCPSGQLNPVAARIMYIQLHAGRSVCYGCMDGSIIHGITGRAVSGRVGWGNLRLLGRLAHISFKVKGGSSVGNRAAERGSRGHDISMAD